MGVGGCWVCAEPLTPTVASAYDGTNDRLAEIGYDGAGNQMQLNPFTVSYDGENRMAGATSSINGSGSYGYDADGRRVVKAANAASSAFVYDGFGQLAAEYGGTAGGPGGTQYMTRDHLGPTRLVTEAAGVVVQRYDFLPVGEGLAAGMNGRSSLYSVGAYPGTGDGYSVKFTGKERDAETGPDFFNDPTVSKPDVLLHEALHYALRLDDPGLKQWLSAYGFQPEPYGTDDITQWLKANCPDQRK